ncbi:MAG: YbaK/EbsC family protein, partial [Actinobacteria bacterium]|nr:YbaK/EbsC family protein [Actinomycetota bacterium]
MTEALHPNVARVIEAGKSLGLTITTRRFPEGTKTAQDAANAIGVAVGQIVKSLVFG